MRKLFKYLGIFLGLIVVVISLALLTIYFRGIPRYKTDIPKNIKVEITPQRVERGKKLASMLCVKCHLDPKTGRLTGKYLDEVPTEFGEAYSLNITQHPTHGIGSWTDGELVYLLRTGLKRDGQYTPPYMVKLPHMADEDINSIVAFLRSDDELVKASDVNDIPSKPSMLCKILCTVAFKPFEMPKQAIVVPDIKDKVSHGKYLVQGALQCFQCHSADFKSNDDISPEHSVGYCGGGNPMRNHEGVVVRTANITPDKETGIGNWNDAQFLSTVKYGKRPDGQPVKFPMEPYAQLSDEETSAIFAYLQTIPAIQNKIVNN